MTPVKASKSAGCNPRRRCVAVGRAGACMRVGAWVCVRTCIVIVIVAIVVIIVIVIVVQ